MSERRATLKDGHFISESLMLLVKEENGKLIINVPLANKEVVFDLFENELFLRIYSGSDDEPCDNVRIL